MKGDVLIQSFNLKNGDNENSSFSHSKPVLIPMQTSKTTCDSRSVLEYNDPVNCALGKDVFGIKL